MKLSVAYLSALMALYSAVNFSHGAIVFDFEDPFGSGPPDIDPGDPPDVDPPPPPLLSVTPVSGGLGSGSDGSIAYPGEYHLYNETEGGITMSVRRVSTGTFTANNFPFDVVQLGVNGVLAPFTLPTVDDVFMASFSTVVSEASIKVGDFSQDTDSTTFLRAFNSSGVEIASDTSPTWDDMDISADSFAFLSVTDPGTEGISYIIFGGGGSDGLTNYPNSLFWDDVTVVPETANLGLLASLAILGYLRYRRT